MRRVFLIISLLCLMPFTMMAQTRSSSYDEKLEQFYGRSPLAMEITRDAFNGGGDVTLAPSMGYGLDVNGQFVKFDPANPTTTPSSAGMQFEGYDFVSAEVVAFNSTTDHIYAFASDGKFCLIDPQANEITVLGTRANGPMTELAYDVTTHTMYGLRLGVMYTVNMENGECTSMNDMLTGNNNWAAIAIDMDGKMYGMINTFSNENADMYYINTTTWNSTKVGTVPYKTQYAQSMAFDRGTGDLYWWQASASGFNFLKVDPTDATCTALWPNNSYQLSGMFFKYAPFTYPITYETVENGTFSGPAFAAENDVVEVTVTPDYGYRLGTLTWNDNEIDVEAGAPYTFTMVDEAVTVSGSFLLSLHNIIVLDPKDGTLATEPANEGIYPNTIVVVPTPDPGFGVASITYSANGIDNTITAEPYEFSMPDYDVTVSAVYEQTGENTVYIGTDYYGYFDDIVTVAVEMDNENLVAGTQMNIVLGDNLTFVPGSLALTERAEGEGWTIAGNVLSNNTLRVNTFNNGLAYFAGNTGAIFTFQVQCARVVSENTIAITGLVAGTPDATGLTMLTSNGALEILDVVMNQPEDQVVCHNAETAAIEFGTTIEETEGEITYAWTNSKPSIGLAEAGEGDIDAFTATNTGNAAVVANLTVTPTLMHNGNPCVGSTLEFTITVNPNVVMNTPEDQVVCNGTNATAVEFGTTITDGTMSYAWTNNNPEIGLAEFGEGDIDAFEAINEGNEAVEATITVTPTYTNNEISCEGESVNFTITVNPTPVMVAVDNKVVCNGTEIEAIAFATNVTDGEVTYAWTNDNAEIGLAEAGEGNIAAFTATNTGNAAIEANISVIPTYTNNGVECVGEAMSFTITVNPTPVMVEIGSTTVCNGDEIDDIEFATNVTDGTVTYAWTNDNAAIGLAAAGEGNIEGFTAANTGNAAIEANISVTPTYSNQGVDCVGEPFTFTITVNPTPVMVEVENIAVCDGTEVEAIEFATNVTDGEVTYAWTNTNAEIGLAEAGEGNIAAFTATNTTLAAISGTITVVPTYTNNEVACVGEPMSFTITVNPQVIMNTPEAQVVCNGTEVAAVEFGTTLTDGTMAYAWTNDKPEIGLAAAGNGDIEAFEATNTTGAPIVATITVTPTYTNNEISCEGTPVSFTITVNPTPVMVEVGSTAVCDGDEIEAIEFATNITEGTVTYAWVNTNAEIGLAEAGEGNIAAFTATNTTLATISGTITVTPTYTNEGVECVGEPMSFTITVNPQVVMNTPEDQAVCNGGNTAAVEFGTTLTDGTMTYAWTNDNAEIGLAAAGEGNIAAFTAVNTGNAAAVANISVTPTYTNNEISCEGAPVSFTYTVYPAVVMNEVEDMIVCDNSEIAVAFGTTITDGEMTYAWTNDNTAIGLAAAGTGDIAFVSANVNGEPLVANITVTPTYTNNGVSCVGEAQTFSITVYPTPVLNEVEDQVIYSREYTEDIIFTSNITDNKVVFNWVNDNPAIGLAAEGTGNILSFMGAAPITTTQVAHITATPVYTDVTTCEGASINFTITVEPTYLVVIAEGIENGTLTDNAHVAANGDHYAIPGEEITLTATPAADYVLENVTATMLTNPLVNVPIENDEMFVMPDFDVEVNATFIDEDNILIKPGIIDLGYRPINAWMYSKFFEATNISEANFNIVDMDLTDDSFFNLDPVSLPFAIAAGETAEFGINTNYKNVAPGLKNATLAMIAQHNRKPYMREVVANAYTPVEPDVWELATNVTTYPYVTTQETEGVIYNNYQLPGNNEDGYDGVYKLVFDHDMVLNAEITDGENPKVILYDEGFRQVGGPHLYNFHGAPADVENVATVGTGTVTNNYMPFNTYYKYSFAQMLYTAEELTAAGLAAGELRSIEFNTNSTNNYTRDNISIWMANVNVTEMTTTCISTSGMPLVFTGSHTISQGWNEFVFNGAPFTWDGSSNLLVTIVMNHGAYNSNTPWLCSTTDFNASCYVYRDGSPYYPSAGTFSVTAVNTRLNAKFNGKPIVTEVEIGENTPITDLGLFAGTYYLVASTTSDDSYTLEINAEDAPLPLAPTAIYPAHEAQGIETPVTFQFELGEYTHEYQLLLGTAYNSQEVVVDWTDDLTGIYEAGELHHNTIYFWRINERNTTGVTEGPLWVFTTELNVPENLTLEADELFEGDNAVLSWDIVADRTILGYNIYQDGVKINTTPVTETTYAVSGLTYNMDGYEFNVTAQYAEGESDFSNTVTAYYSGYGVIGGHVYEQDGTTGIAGASVIIIGFDEFDELVDYEFTTNENGAYSGEIHAGYYFGLVSKEGYQTTGDNTGIAVDYEDVIDDYDFILNEDYVAVTRVVAEEIDANNVHVFWGWDSIEDFETGDFAAYEWVNNGTYPWAITTTNPYEGNYCMKSTNAGVASSTSAIEITMTNASDGMLSFFAKISSEASYDKGIFYVDGVAKTTLSGAGSWTEKQVPVTAGTHTYKWSYEKDSSVNSNDDCFYVDYINFFFEPEPLPEGTYYFDFETGMQGWTAIDADGDGHNWDLISALYSSTGGNNSADGVASQSYASGALTPDNWLVSPQVDLGGTITFYAAAYSTSFADEHFGVYVSTTGTNPSDFVSIQEWTSLANKGEVHGTDHGRDAKVGNWNPYTADLSAYEGQKGYVAIRHHDCTDEWAILVDDITIQPRYRSFQNFNVYRKNELTGATVSQIASGVTEMEYTDNTWGNAAPGVYRWGVSAVYQGNRGESEITWSNAIDKDMFATVNVAVTTNSNDPVTGAVVTLANTGETEYTYTTTLDETGTYSWDEVRKGEYNVTVELAGFAPIAATASVWGTTNLTYVLTELIEAVEDLYVSTTGWAMFGEVPSVEPPVGMATITMNIGDVWGDGSGYQMLLDADANAYGVTIPTSGALSTNCSGNEAIYAEFEYKIPENADGNCSTQNIVLNNVISIQIPAGTYDWCITNPTPGDRIWIASAQGNVGGRQDDYVFEAGKTYTFSVYMLGSNDATDVTITDGKGVVANTVMPMPNNDAKNINDVVAVNNGYVVLPANTRSVEHYNVKLDGVMEGTTELPFFQHNVEGFAEGSTHNTQVQKVYTTGDSEWVSFDWVYTPCDNYEGLAADPTAEWQGTDVVLNWVLPGGEVPPTPPTPPTGDDNFSFDFEGGLQGWTTIDADGNGLNWYHSSNSTSQSGYDYTGLGHNGSNGFAVSQSFIDYDGAYQADNYLITPQKYVITSGSTLTFWADNANDSYPDNFGVYVATADNPTANDFTQVWQGTAKTNGNKAAVRHDANRYNNWRQHTVNLGAYAGQAVWIAFRHNDYDMYEIWIDDVALTASKNRSTNYDFEGGLQGWTTIDADGNGLNWYHSSNSTSQSGYDYTGLGHNGSNGFAVSQSFIDYDGAYQADNYLVSPQMFALQSGSNIEFWADNANDSYPDNFGVYVATAANPTANDFTQVWQGTAKTNDNKAAVRHDANRYNNWRQHTVDLSSYAGQTVWIAFRHNDYDMYEIWIDDVTINAEGGTTPVDPVDPNPEPADNIIGVEIFRDGEWIAEVQSPAQTYTDVEVVGPATYEIRVVYDGLTEDYTYYAMSCPQAVSVEDNPCAVTPDNLTGTYDWTSANEFGALISWTYGEGAEWLYYDDGTPATTIGEGDAHLPFYWGIMIPATDLAIYNGFSLTKVAFHEYNVPGNYTVNIYQGGSSAPGTLVHTQTLAVTGTTAWNYVDLTANVGIDVSQNLWITLYNDGDIAYPAVCCANTGDPNGRWVSEDGAEWFDIAAAGLSYTWMVRGFITNAVEADELIALEPFNGGGNNTMNFSAVEFNANANEFDFNKGMREPVSFNVYRNGSVVGNVAYNGDWRYEYFDNVPAGNYDYQVTAVYDACESGFAMTPDMSQDYVEVNVTGVSENFDARLYPNPTNGNVVIEASNMKHITVFSTLGQILYDANISGDTYTMNLGQFKAGLYMVRIYTDNGVSVKRVTVVK